jgi:hypothetical protein
VVSLLKKRHKHLRLVLVLDLMAMLLQDFQVVWALAVI